ncbi:MAG: alpha/beta fold hydrolase, partial [Betaproteobacteria bacterium]
MHGYLGGSSQWLAEMERLRLHFDVIAIDLAGYGDARHLTAPKSIAAHAQSVLNTLDQLGIQNFHLLGHSMGGMIVQEIVYQVPTRVVRLVLYATGPQGSIPGR